MRSADPAPSRETVPTGPRPRYPADIFSESAIYGLIMVSALIVVTRRYEITSAEVFVKVLGTVVVFWLAHLFASALARLSTSPEGGPAFRESFRHAMKHSAGLLLAAVVPLGIMLLGVVNLIHDDIAVWTALWADVLLLGLLGYLASRGWTRNRAYRLLAAVVTTSLGLAIVLLKVLMH